MDLFHKLLRMDQKFWVNPPFYRWVVQCVLHPNSQEQKLHRLTVLWQLVVNIILGMTFFHSVGFFNLIIWLIVIENSLFNASLLNYQYESEKSKMWELLKNNVWTK